MAGPLYRGRTAVPDEAPPKTSAEAAKPVRPRPFGGAFPLATFKRRSVQQGWAKEKRLGPWNVREPLKRRKQPV